MRTQSWRPFAESGTRRLDNILFVDGDDISTAVGVLGSDEVIRELRVLRVDNDLMGTASSGRVERENRLQLAPRCGVTGRGRGGHFGYEEGRRISITGEGRLMRC